MADIQCRQCGHRSPASEHPMGAFRCPWCDWREVLHMPTRAERAAAELPAKNGVGKENRGVAAGDNDAQYIGVDEEIGRNEDLNSEGREVVESESARKRVGSPLPNGATAMTPVARPASELALADRRAFIIQCGRLFERFGYAVKIIEDEMHDRDCDLKLTKHDQVAYVDCIGGSFTDAPSADVSVSLAACQRLVGAMVGRQAHRGMIITAGRFAPGCAEWVKGINALCIDLIDGRELAATHEAISSGPLSKWCA